MPRVNWTTWRVGAAALSAALLPQQPSACFPAAAAARQQDRQAEQERRRVLRASPLSSTDAALVRSILLKHFHAGPEPVAPRALVDREIESLILQLRQYFAAVQDDSGMLSKAKVLEQPADASLGPCVELVWRAIDRDGDGKLSCAEFLLMTVSALASHEDKLAASFAALDADGDGLLDAGEVGLWIQAQLLLAARDERYAAEGPDQAAFAEGYREAIEQTRKLDRVGAEAEESRQQLVDQIVADLFRRYDKSSDGKLQREEFAQIAKGDFVPITKETTKPFLSRVVVPKDTA